LESSPSDTCRKNIRVPVLMLQEKGGRAVQACSSYGDANLEQSLNDLAFPSSVQAQRKTSLVFFSTDITNRTEPIIELNSPEMNEFAPARLSWECTVPVCGEVFNLMG